MILKFTLRLTYDDGHTVDVTTNARDQVAFERHFGVSILDLLPKSLIAKGVAAAAEANGNGQAPTLALLDGDDLSLKTERFLWIAWHAANRKGLEPLGFDEFCDVVSDIGWDFAPAVPTQPAPLTGS